MLTILHRYFPFHLIFRLNCIQNERAMLEVCQIIFLRGSPPAMEKDRYGKYLCIVKIVLISQNNNKKQQDSKKLFANVDYVTTHNSYEHFA